jgi:signal transduction histidine kinase
VRVRLRVLGVVLLASFAAAGVLGATGARSHTEAERDARTSAASAVPSVADAVRGALTAAASGAGVGARQADATVPASVQSRARDLGTPVLDDSTGAGTIVVARYAGTAPPVTSAARRLALVGFTVVPLDLKVVLQAQLATTGGLALVGPDRPVLQLPERQPGSAVSFAIAVSPTLAPGWSLVGWVPEPTRPRWAWPLALVLFVGGLVIARSVAGAARAVADQLDSLRRTELTSATVAGLANVVQRSLDLAEVLPAAASALSESFGLRGLSLSKPSATGERRVFVWGDETDASIHPTSDLPAELPVAATMALTLTRGGRALGVLRVLAGRSLLAPEVRALSSAGELLCSALANAEAFAEQRELVHRMRAVDELKTVFLATASHELRTPIAAITGFAKLLATSWKTMTPEQVTMYTGSVETSARRLGRLVEDLLDFARLERGANLTAGEQVLDLGELVTTLMDDQPDLVVDHLLSVHVAAGSTVRGTPAAVERVLSNLIGNAAKYSPAGTTITVRVRDAGDRVELIVDDEGAGIPEGDREQIFSRFYRGRGDAVVRTRGAGLGLAIVKEFAGSMSADVTASAAPSGGARFVVSYPRYSSTRTEQEGESHGVA